MITVSNLVKTYQSSNVKTQALRGVNLKVAQGEFVSIIGRSGCGKSTLLNILGGMDYPTSGGYMLDKVDVHGLTGRQLARFRNSTIGYVFQAFNLIKELDILENVVLPLGYAGIGLHKRRELGIAALTKVGLGGKIKKRPTQLSGGEQQRVALARAIVNSPKILLADEPTGNLDEDNSEVVMDLIKELHNNGSTIIMVTHDLDIASAAQRVLRMADGKFVS